MVVLNGTPVGFLNKADVGASPFKTGIMSPGNNMRWGLMY